MRIVDQYICAILAARLGRKRPDSTSGPNTFSLLPRQTNLTDVRSIKTARAAIPCHRFCKANAPRLIMSRTVDFGRFKKWRPLQAEYDPAAEDST